MIETATQKDKTNHSIIARTLFSLTKVTANETNKDILLKFVTFLNLVKKSVGDSPRLTSWKFGDCIIEANFKGNVYQFILPNSFDFNIYLNPYFHEYEVTQFVSTHLHYGEIFLDVGAHGGLYTIIASSKVGERGVVVSFEPNPLNTHFLKKNIMLNHLKNILVVPKAVSCISGKIPLFYASQETALTTVESASAKYVIEAEAVTLDEHTFKMDRIKIIKIDTEGNDFNVLKGASETLKKTSYLVIEQNTHSVRNLLSNNFHLTTFQPSGYLLAVNKSISPECSCNP
jgi:FkbM family methyltransferase